MNTTEKLLRDIRAHFLALALNARIMCRALKAHPESLAFWLDVKRDNLRLAKDIKTYWAVRARSIECIVGADQFIAELRAKRAA